MSAVGMAVKRGSIDPFGPTIVVSAANAWDGIPMADQQLAAALSRISSVLYVDPPASAISRVRKGGVGTAIPRNALTFLGPRLARISPEGVPGLCRPGIAPLNSRLSALQVRIALSKLQGHAAACLEANTLVPVLGQIGERVKAYWAQDDFVGMAPLVGGSARAYAAANARLAKSADLIIAANPIVAQSFKGATPAPALIPFGCDVRHFESALHCESASEIFLERPYAVFMGHLGDRIDVPILERLVDDGVRVLLVGPLHPRTPIGRFASLLRKGGVQWVGARPFAELPRYLAGASVGLVPYTHSRFNEGSFPLKSFEYLAAGLPVVSTTLPAMRWMASNDVHLADGPESFSGLVRDRLFAGRTAGGDERRRVFASNHSWDERAVAVFNALGLARAGGVAQGSDLDRQCNAPEGQSVEKADQQMTNGLPNPA